MFKLTIIVHEVLVCAIPDFFRDLAAVVQVHTHTLLLRTLTSEDIGCSRLLNFGFAKKDLVLGLLVANFDFDDLATRHHAYVL